MSGADGCIVWCLVALIRSLEWEWSSEWSWIKTLIKVQSLIETHSLRIESFTCFTIVPTSFLFIFQLGQCQIAISTGWLDSWNQPKINQVALVITVADPLVLNIHEQPWEWYCLVCLVCCRRDLYDNTYSYVKKYLLPCRYLLFSFCLTYMFPIIEQVLIEYPFRSEMFYLTSCCQIGSV